MSNPLAGKDLLSTQTLSREAIELIIAQASTFEAQCQEKRKLDVLEGYILATLFYEPSTRTRLSFETAMHRLGGDVISVAEATKSSSAKKGETIADATRVIAGYADVIVQRHPRPYSAEEAAEGATVPVINAGDGSHEHPTQALLDLYTIAKERGQIDSLRIALVGDLRYGRTVHSLAYALANFDVQLTLVSPPALKMSAQIVDEVRSDIPVIESDDLASALERCDVAYVTRIQKERFDDPADYEALKASYQIDRSLVKRTNPEATLMHPLPRVNEIAPEVDQLPNAAYFRQATNGVWARMAILALVLGAKVEG